MAPPAKQPAPPPNRDNPSRGCCSAGLFLAARLPLRNRLIDSFAGPTSRRLTPTASVKAALMVPFYARLRAEFRSCDSRQANSSARQLDAKSNG